MVKPERRTRADIIAAGALVAIVALIAAAIWWTSDSRATVSQPASAPSKSVPPARAVPTTLKELWNAPSPATALPVVASGTVVTGAGQTVEGRDPISGAVRWTYARDLKLCGLTWIYQYAVAVYPDSRGCGQVSTVDSSTGKRGPTRTSYADNEVKLFSTGTLVLSTGPTRLETWRSDMVRVIAYGEIDARVKPNQTGIGKGCRILSAAAATAQVALLQSCAGENDVRLTLLKPGKDDDEPEVRDVPQPGVHADGRPRILAVSDTAAAVYLPTPQPRVSVVDESGKETSSAAVPTAPIPAALADTAAVSRVENLVTWWTGDAVMVFNADKMTHKFTIDSTGPTRPLGPATLMADRLLVPITSGIGVYDTDTGDIERVIPFGRPAMRPGSGVIATTVIGPTLLEQRGGQLFALG